MKKKIHRFIIDVKTKGSRRDARLDLLVAFSSRKPDGSEFHLRRTINPRKGK